MSFLWGPSPQQAEFDALLDQTTSDLLPSSTPPDLARTLQLADVIRSSAITPQAATRSLLRRVKHENPNVQLLALSVLDICIKNGGTPFLLQVGGKESAQELDSLGRGKEGTNRDVKERVIGLIQDWATAFQGKKDLRDSELVRVYQQMKNEGLPFPPRDPTATAAMVDSLSAPEWTDSAYCTRCRTEFTTFNRKHHCRNCGDVFDQQCSAQTAPLPHYGITEPVRVCDGCIKKVKEGKGAAVGLARSSSLGSSRVGNRPGLPERSSTVSYSTSHSHTKKSAAKSKEDEDFEKAIAASLLESNPSAVSGPAFQLRQPSAKSGYNPAYTESSKSSAAKAAYPGDAEDADLAAAIAASLRDVAPRPSAPQHQSSTTPATYASLYRTENNYHTSAYPSLNTQSPPAAASTRYAALTSYDLSPTESSSLNDFTQILERPPPQLGTRERELYEHARRAQPRLERGLQDAERRKEILLEMNQKLGEATRIYQGLLEGNATQYTQQYTQPAYAPAPQPPVSYAPNSQYNYVPQPFGQALPFSPAPISSPAAPTQPQYTQPDAQYNHQPQPVQQQPAGYYKASSFPAVPSGASAAFFPSVPEDNPWERDKERNGEEETKVGELIEL